MYRTDPFIPQQAESVEALVEKTGRSSFDRLSHIQAENGDWHRLSNSKRKHPLDDRGRSVAGYWTICRLFVPATISRTRIGGVLNCDRGCGR